MELQQSRQSWAFSLVPVPPSVISSDNEQELFIHSVCSESPFDNLLLFFVFFSTPPFISQMKELSSEFVFALLVQSTEAES